MVSDWGVWGSDAEQALCELLAVPSALPLTTVVVGASVSEVAGQPIGTRHNLEAAKEILSHLLRAVPAGVALAIQGCEHINRALVVERAFQRERGWPLVSVWPVLEAGGSFAAAAMELFADPVVVGAVEAEAGLDIGQTLIGMHLKPVVVPVRVKPNRVGQAVVTAGRSRPPLIGGARARYGPDSPRREEASSC